MPNVKSKRLIPRENRQTNIDYSDMAALQEHPLGAVRRGLYAAHLAHHRMRRGLSQAELARQLDVAQPTVDKWERGLTGLSWLDARRVAEVLQLHPKLLYGDPLLRSDAAVTPPREGAVLFSGPNGPPAGAGQRWWQITGSRLDAIGLPDGCLVLIGPAEDLRDGDLVLAALAETDGSTHNLLRIVAGDYLVGAVHGPTQPAPLPLTPGRLAIRGVGLATFRFLRTSDPTSG